MLLQSALCLLDLGKKKGEEWLSTAHKAASAAIALLVHSHSHWSQHWGGAGAGGVELP